MSKHFFFSHEWSSSRKLLFGPSAHSRTLLCALGVQLYMIHLGSLESTTAAPLATNLRFIRPLQISYVHHNLMVHDKANLSVKSSTSGLPSCRNFESSSKFYLHNSAIAPLSKSKVLGLPLASRRTETGSLSTLL